MRKSEAARTFGVSRSSVKRYAAARREGRSLTPKKHPGLETEDRREGQEAAGGRRGREARRDAQGQVPLLEGVAGVSVSESTLSRLLRKMGFSPKERSVVASERDEFLRAAWRALVVWQAGRRGASCSWTRCSTNTSLSPIYGWSRRGTTGALRGAAQLGQERHAALEHDARGDGAVAGGGGTDHPTEVFEAYVEQGPRSGDCVPGQIVVMEAFGCVFLLNADRIVNQGHLFENSSSSSWRDTPRGG